MSCLEPWRPKRVVLTIAAEAAKAAFRGDAPRLRKEAGTDLADIRSGALADSVAQRWTLRWCARLIEQAAESIGIAVVNVVHMLAPDKIVLGGGLVEAMEDLFVGTVSKTARKNVMSVYKDRFEVVAAKLADDAGVMGAAAWARHVLKKGLSVEPKRWIVDAVAGAASSTFVADRFRHGLLL